MTEKNFYTLFGEALVASDREAFASDWSLSSIWGEDDAAEGDELIKRAEQLGKLWDIAHMTYPELLKLSDLTNAQFSVRFCIPRRTAQNWAAGSNSCPQWCILGFARQLGLL